MKGKRQAISDKDRTRRRDPRPATRDPRPATPERKPSFKTLSGIPLNRVYTKDDLKGWNPATQLGNPGEFPYTRGVYPTMYRGRLWTYRQFSGMGTPFDTNARYKYLIEHGQTGLSVAFDLPCLMGRDADDPHSEGEVGMCGVNVSSLEDMEVLFDGINLADITTSMTINAPAAAIWAMYLAVAEKQGADLRKIGGTIQNDILKEFIAQKEWIFPPEPHMKLIVDTVEFTVKHVPKWHPISISGYHIREAGSTAVQELAFTLGDGLEYVRWCLDRGLKIDEFAPTLSFFFNSHLDFFEEIAKFRSARRIWARAMRDDFKAKDPKSHILKFHTQTAGVSLMKQQPELNIIRSAFEALAGVLGGTQSLHVNSFDEALALPTERAVRLSLRTQQIIAEETEVTSTADPLGGAYYIEWLTDRMEEEANKYFARVKKIGGVLPGIQQGFFQKEIADAAFQYQTEVDKKERIIVGVNDYFNDEPDNIEILKIEPVAEEMQVKRIRDLRRRRDNRETTRALTALQQACKRDASTNLMPHLIDAVKSYATLGEISETMKAVFGGYREQAVI